MEDEGTDWSRAKSRMQSLAPQGGVTRPEDTQKGAPSPHLLEIFLGTHLPSSPFESSAASRTESWTESGPSILLWAAEGREAGSPWRESPQVRHQSALQTNLGPSIEPALDPGPPRVFIRYIICKKTNYDAISQMHFFLAFYPYM